MAYGYGGWAPYVPVAERRRMAERAKWLAQEGYPVSPVRIEGRTIARTFWGKSWCENLESYRDYENRLPRGRTYVRNGSVVDLQITPLEVTAMVSGSELYTVKISIKAMPKPQWQCLCRDCAGGIDSLVELLQGRFPRASWSGSAVRTMACFPNRRKSGSRAVALTRRRCANTSPPCCMVSAHASTSSRSFCFACARWTIASWWLIWTRLCPCRRRHQLPGKFLKPMTSRTVRSRPGGRGESHPAGWRGAAGLKRRQEASNPAPAKRLRCERKAEHVKTAARKEAAPEAIEHPSAKSVRATPDARQRPRRRKPGAVWDPADIYEA